MSRPEAVLFDKDGTILPFAPFWTTWTRVFRDALAEAVEVDLSGGGLLDWPANTRTASHGASLDVATMGDVRVRVAAMLRDGGVAAADARRIVAAASDTADAVAAAMPVTAHEGFVEVVDALAAAGVRLGVVTGDDEGRAVRQVAALALADRLPVVVGGDRGLPGKPDPATLLEACTLLGVDPGGCVYVGDSLVDVRAARSAGFSLAIAYVPTDAELPSWSGEADAVLRSFADLAPLWGDAPALDARPVRG